MAPAPALSVPLASGPGGIVRLARTRVTLDAVAFAFRNGASAEEIAMQYPTLGLADVYAVLAYVLSHEKEVEAYLAERQAGSLSDEANARAPQAASGIRDRLVARRGKAA